MDTAFFSALDLRTFCFFTNRGFPFEEGSLNTQEILECAHNLQRDMVGFAPRLSRVVPDFRARFAPALAAYPLPFQIKKLRDDGAFAVATRQLVFNLNSFRLFHAPIDRMERQGLITADNASIARQIAIEQLIVHEMTHLTVGLINFEDVQHLKTLMGPNILGELDLIADATAARICARLEMYRAEEKRTANYAWRLQQQLFVMGNFALPAFGAPADKPHKRRRFLGLAMMTARLNDFLNQSGRKLPAIEYPIDTPLYPYVDPASGVMLISAFNADRTIWGKTANVDAGLLKLTYDEIETATFAETVNRASMLLKQAGVLRSSTEQLQPARAIVTAAG